MSAEPLLVLKLTRRGCASALVGLAILLLLCGATSGFWLPGVATALLVQTPLREADALIVLSGDLGERVETALELLDEGWAEKVIFSGGQLNPYRTELTAAARMRELALRWGADPALLYVEEASTSTMENALRTRELAEQLGLESVLIVTSDFHTRRAYYTFRKVFGPAGLSVGIRAAPNPHFPLERWWDSETGLITVQNEWLRLVWYLIRFGIVPWG